MWPSIRSSWSSSTVSASPWWRPCSSRQSCGSPVKKLTYLSYIKQSVHFPSFQILYSEFILKFRSFRLFTFFLFFYLRFLFFFKHQFNFRYSIYFSIYNIFWSDPDDLICNTACRTGPSGRRTRCTPWPAYPPTASSSSCPRWPTTSRRGPGATSGRGLALIHGLTAPPPSTRHSTTGTSSEKNQSAVQCSSWKNTGCLRPSWKISLMLNNN